MTSALYTLWLEHTNSKDEAASALLGLANIGTNAADPNSLGENTGPYRNMHVNLLLRLSRKNSSSIFQCSI